MFKRLKRLTWLAIAVGLGVTTVALIAMTWSDVRKAIATLTWPHVTGKIIDRFVEAEYIDPDWRYHSRVAYRYAVQGKEYTGMEPEILPSSARSSREQAYSDLESFGTTNNVNVYYDPQQPAVGFIVRQPQIHVLFTWVGALLTLATSLISAYAFHTWQKRGV